MSAQSFSSIARQVAAIAAVIMGSLTAALPSLHLPAAVSALLVALGGAVFAVEHYVADPSTGKVPPVTVSVEHPKAVAEAAAPPTMSATPPPTATGSTSVYTPSASVPPPGATS
jgi:hypothetical protein